MKKKDAIRCKANFFFFRNVLGPILWKPAGYEGKRIKLDNKPYLIVGNHTENIDPGIMLTTFNKYMRFVASDHLIENPFIHFLLWAAVDPIIKRQGNSPDVIYNEMVETLKEGLNVQVYPEGRVSDTGRTGYMSKRNATLVKEGGAGLITFRTTGGYFRHPRWADTYRKGPMHGEMVHKFSPEEIAKMSEEEIFEIIRKDTMVDAYEVQREMKVPYKDPTPAQSAEIILYGCPKCHSIGTLHTKGDEIKCSHCGGTSHIDEYGFWHGDLVYDNIPDWDDFQKDLMKSLVEEHKGTSDLLFSDEDQIISTSEGDDYKTLTEHGSITLYADRIELEGENFSDTIKLSDITKIAYAGRQTLQLVGGKYYHVKSHKPRSASKYVVAVRYLLGKENY